jgi:TPP-dependent trihydroxycyclohexane-1,2-dione (THcHDO) dehydratase
VIHAGGGVHRTGAHDTLRRGAEHPQAGIVESDEGKGARPACRTLAFGAGLGPGKTTYEP